MMTLQGRLYLAASGVRPVARSRNRKATTRISVSVAGASARTFRVAFLEIISYRNHHPMTESTIGRTVRPVNIEDEMKKSYLDYAMSVIVGRALPDVRDGLKPVHRRVLYAMHEMKNEWNKKHVKSSRVVGEVMGKYHPHGESAIYDTIVRMAQDFSLRHVLVDGQGNFGSVDGDAAAASRYTEVRMSRLAHEMLRDIEKNTVDFEPNYDGEEQEPLVLPTMLPNLLVNGSNGIAVGMATNIPPHNLSEVIDACLHLLNHPDSPMDELLSHVQGPDFPTAGIIDGSEGIHLAYRTGRGKIYIRARTTVEEDDTGQRSIIVTELPYQVNKARLQMKIAELVKQKYITGIRDLRDESDREGMRIVIELTRDGEPDLVLENLYRHTPMRTVFGINLVALSSGKQPQLLNLKEILAAFISHRREVTVRRSRFDLRRARNRAHTLEGLALALANIDTMVQLIRNATSPAEARQSLMARSWPLGLVQSLLDKFTAGYSRPEGLDKTYGLHEDGYYLSPQQTQSILELRLQKLTGLERHKIEEEFKSLLQTITELQIILNDPKRLTEVLCQELQALQEQYSEPRRTKILGTWRDRDDEDLILKEDMVVTLSHVGYIKAQPLDTYGLQRRGGTGKLAQSFKEEDGVRKLLIASSHDIVLFFSSHGMVYCEKVYRLPRAGRNARGKPLVNWLPLAKDESINTMLALDEFSGQHLFMATAQGIVKKTSLSAYARLYRVAQRHRKPGTEPPRGLRAIRLDAGDRLTGVELTNGDNDIMLCSNVGKAIRFHESTVRAMGRVTRGVRGMRVATGEQVIALMVVHPGNFILSATKNGYGKRTPEKEYPRKKNRGGLGVVAIQANDRNGEMVAAIVVDEDDEIVLVSSQGQLIRSPAREVRLVSRNAQGVRLVKLREGTHLVGLARAAGDEDVAAL